jgi:ABC-type multidrug transport system fused ATPase/permease subunit
MNSSIFVKRLFKRNYRKAGCLARVTYTFALPLINSVNRKGKMDIDVLEDMNIKDSETEEWCSKFMANFEKLEGAALRNSRTKNGKKPNYGNITWNACVKTFYGEYLLAAILNLLCELSSVTYIYSLIYLIGFLRDDDAELQDGLILAGIFSFFTFSARFFSNISTLMGYRASLKIRRTLVMAMYKKVSKISMKSLAQTESGKLITLVSSDIFSIEKGLALLPFALGTPIINFTIYYIIGITYSWYQSGICFATWILVVYG